MYLRASGELIFFLSNARLLIERTRDPCGPETSWRASRRRWGWSKALKNDCASDRKASNFNVRVLKPKLPGGSGGSPLGKDFGGSFGSR